ncbi:hypothetical protein SAMN05444483_11439 [Salegentibacter echinorum]|uniref:Uncharacterized protein n=1 Tax=Salegentibacter echinorum TaxID=1073325 RepID=A0A1M5KDE3_SALEC|nr:hypothetical protein SAMN05444483_11439 [Salegentibacter echinorum]
MLNFTPYSVTRTLAIFEMSNLAEENYKKNI